MDWINCVAVVQANFLQNQKYSQPLLLLFVFRKLESVEKYEREFQVSSPVTPIAPSKQTWMMYYLQALYTHLLFSLLQLSLFFLPGPYQHYQHHHVEREKMSMSLFHLKIDVFALVSPPSLHLSLISPSFSLHSRCIQKRKHFLLKTHTEQIYKTFSLSIHLFNIFPSFFNPLPHFLFQSFTQHFF